MAGRAARLQPPAARPSKPDLRTRAAHAAAGRSGFRGQHQRTGVRAAARGRGQALQTQVRANDGAAATERDAARPSLRASGRSQRRDRRQRAFFFFN